MSTSHTYDTPNLFASLLPHSFIKSLSVRVKEVNGINLGQGIPSFSPATHIIDAAKQALDEPDVHVYPHLMGNPDLRDAIGTKLSTEHKNTFSPDNILVTVGAMEATASIIFSLINDGDRVGVITPNYANHFSQIQLARGVCREIPLIEREQWSLDLHKIESEAKMGMKLLIITNPNNPTGAIFDRSSVDALVSLSKKYGFWVLSDETYHFLSFGSEVPSLLDWWGDDTNMLFVVRSLSKEYAMSGWRIGYLVAPKPLRNFIARAHDALVGTAPRISQRAAYAAIAGPQEAVQGYVNILKERRNQVHEFVDRFKNILSYCAPQGAYYAFIKYKLDSSSLDLTEDILNKATVGVLPGSIFGSGGENHFRVSFGVDDATLEDGLEKLAGYFS